MNYGTYTSTYTVVNIRKAFEGFEGDLRMIARRTEKWSIEYVDKVFHDIVKLAENKYVKCVSVHLDDYLSNPVKAAKYTVNENGTSISGERAGGNDWSNISNTTLHVTVEYTAAWHSLTQAQKDTFQSDNNFKCNWSPSSTNTSFPNLRRESAQTYASSGYELKKENFK